MITLNKVLRVILIAVFMFHAMAGFNGAIHTVFCQPAGSDAASVVGVWMWTGLILCSAYALIAGVGLARKRMFGILFGYTVPPGILAMFLIELKAHGWQEIEAFGPVDFMWTALFLAVPVFMFLALLRIRKDFPRLTRSAYTASALLAVVMLVAFLVDA